MIIDFAGCWLIELICKHLFADLEPKDMITRGRERRERRRRLQEIEAKAVRDGKP
jgi:cation-transporting ATPase 13A1